MAFLGFSRANIPQWIPVPWRTKAMSYSDVKYIDADNVSLVLNKLSEAFVSGDFIPPKGMAKPNLMTDWVSLEQRFYWLYKGTGVGYLYFKDSSVYLLDNLSGDLNLTFKNNATIFNTLDFMSALSAATYRSNNSTINLLTDGGEIVPIYDIGMDNNFQPISRLKQIDTTCELAERTTEALNGAMKRTAMTFVSKKDGTKAKMPMGNVPQDKTDQQIAKEREKFGEDFKLDSGAVQWSNQPLEIAEANPDNRKLQGLETDRRTIEKIATQLGQCHTLLFEDTKYDNATVYIGMQYEQTIMPDSEKYYKVLNEKLNKNMSRDFTRVLDTLIEKNNEQTTTTQGQEETE